MNSPKLATQVKIHNWTLQERGRVELQFLFSPIIFFFSWHFKKGVQQLGGRVFGGRSPFMHLTRVMFRIHPKVSNETRKLGLFRLVKNRAKLVCFPTTDPSSELHTRVKSCQKLPKKPSNYMLYQVGRLKLKKYFFCITYVKISCKFICTFLAQNSP